jgi:hypothetical protein
MNMNLKPRMGDVLVRETRPAEFVEVKDASGNIVSNEQTMPAIYQVADTSAVASGGGIGIMPILLAVGAAWMMAKG